MLTQAEVDALLAGTIEAEEPNSETRVNLAEIMGKDPAPAQAEPGAKRVQPYNFWSPDRFTKDQMRAVELLHEDLAERLITSLPSFLHTNLRPRVTHTEQGRFHDFLKDLNEHTIFYLLTLNPLPGQLILTISPDICAVILERRLGGTAARTPEQRVFTEIDQSLLRGLVEHMLGEIKAAWTQVIAVEPKLADSTTNHHWVQMTVGNERMTLIVFELSIEGVTGTMNFYIPFTLLKPIANQLNPHFWISGYKERSIDPKSQQAAFQAFSQVTLPMRVLLGNAQLTVGEFVNLQEGDIIRLDKDLNHELEVQVAGKPYFWARAGGIGRRLAIQITSQIHPSGVSK